jgi:predicted RNase H-like HicB family nuclease
MTIVLENESKKSAVSWERIPDEGLTAYRCLIAMVREEHGGYSAIVVNLPGCGSCGDSEEEAIENVKEAIQGTIESYIEAGKDIPWVDPTLEEKLEGTVRTTWIVVNA